MSDKQTKKPPTYDCKPCNFISTNKALYNRHLLTPKHKSKLNTIPSQEDLQLLEEKRQSLLNKRTSPIERNTTDCPNCHTSNVSSYHISSSKFCANKIKYAQDLINKYQGDMTVDELLQEFNTENTIKAFAQAFKKTYELEPLPYDKQPNGKRPSPKQKPEVKQSPKPPKGKSPKLKSPKPKSPKLKSPETKRHPSVVEPIPLDDQLDQDLKGRSDSDEEVILSLVPRSTGPTGGKDGKTVAKVVKKEPLRPKGKATAKRTTGKKIQHMVVTPPQKDDIVNNSSSESEDEADIKFKGYKSTPKRRSQNK